MKREELEQLIKTSEDVLKSAKGYVTKGTELALQDMVTLAKEALEQKELPFTQKREFLSMTKEDRLQFAAKRYTMAPTYLADGMVYSYYGLEPALKWFRERDIRTAGEEGIRKQADFVIRQAKEALKTWKTGAGTGCYGEGQRADLQRALDELKTSQGCTDQGKAVVRCMDCLTRFRHSRVLRGDLYPDDTLFLTADETEALKHRIEEDPVLKQEFERIRKLSETYTPDYLKEVFQWNFREDCYEELNQHYMLWSSTGSTVNFVVPEPAVYGELSFYLPSECRESQGLGHVWIDDVGIFSASGRPVEIENAGFELGDDVPYGWRKDSLGNGIVGWEGRPHYGGTQARSIYLENNCAGDRAGCRHQRKLPLEANGRYTLAFRAKLDGKLKKGLCAKIGFTDMDGNSCGEFCYEFNKKSYLTSFDFLLTAQCDAIMYRMTGVDTYAGKVKYQILHSLNDFCQGAQHWMVTNTRPDNSDAYGAVQGGRILCSIASAYSLVKHAGVFSAAEKAGFYGMTEYMLRYMMDLRDRTELSPEEAQHNCGNWQTDMCAGTGMMMMVLDDFPNRRVWLENATYILKSQLEQNMNPDGSWPESIRYHHAALERFAEYARVMYHNTGEDWFSGTGLARMFDFGVRVQTPAYEYFEGNIGTPPFGDHKLGGGEEYGIYGIYLKEVRMHDKELADRMYLTWQAAGAPMKELRTESIVLDNLMSAGSSYRLQEGAGLELNSDDSLKNSGIYQFRRQYGQTDQSYLAVMSSPERIAHGHLDQGAFLYYFHSIPLVMDSGIEGYFDSSTNWHLSSYSHACMQFASRQTDIKPDRGMMINLSAGTYSLERGWADVPYSSKVLDCRMGGATESITIQIENPEGEGTHIRTISYDKERDRIVIEDRVEGFAGDVLFNLPVAAQYTRPVTENRLYSRGHYHVDLETTFVSPVKKLTVDQGRTTRFFPSDESVPMLDYIRAVADAKDGFTVVLHPVIRQNKERGVSVENNKRENEKGDRIDVWKSAL